MWQQSRFSRNPPKARFKPVALQRLRRLFLTNHLWESACFLLGPAAGAGRSDRCPATIALTLHDLRLSRAEIASEQGRHCFQVTFLKVRHGDVVIHGVRYSGGFAGLTLTMSDQTTALSRTLAGTATLKLANLHSLDPFYTPLEERFERITRLARRALNVPVAAITVVQGDRQWFKSVLGWQVTELALSKSLCSIVIARDELVIVEDALDDLDLMSCSLVRKKPKFRFYAGFPIKDSNRKIIGTFCVIDTKPRKPDGNFADTLKDLGDMAQRELFAVELSNAQSALVAKLGEARRQAMFDPLTRLWNRRGGLSLLNGALKESLKHDHTLGICVADIDNFKNVNDQFGHRVGDQVLRKVASTIVASVRPQDIVCRYGGDEFLIILRDVNDQECYTIADRICHSVSKLPIKTREGTTPATITIGLAMRNRGDPIATAHLIEKADKALYEGKRKGRNRATVGVA